LLIFSSASSHPPTPTDQFAAIFKTAMKAHNIASVADLEKVSSEIGAVRDALVNLSADKFIATDRLSQQVDGGNVQTYKMLGSLAETVDGLAQNQATYNSEQKSLLTEEAEVALSFRNAPISLDAVFKSATEPRPFNLLVCGFAGLGKTTFIDSLFREMEGYQPIKREHVVTEAGVRTTKIECRRAFKHKKLNALVNCYDTPGFGDDVDNAENIFKIEDYIIDRLGNAEESITCAVLIAFAKLTRSALAACGS
jgi:hypothetical protein